MWNGGGGAVCVICLTTIRTVRHKSGAYHLLVTSHLWKELSNTWGSTRTTFYLRAGVDFTCKLTDSTFVRASFQPQLPAVSITPSDFCATKMSNKGDVQPLINFKNLKGFRAFSDDGKIETILFLDAAKEIVSQIGEYYLLPNVCVCVCDTHTVHTTP